MMTKQRGWIPILSHTVSPNFDFGASKIVISAKGQFAEVVAYNIIHSKMSFENLENFDFDV